MDHPALVPSNNGNSSQLNHNQTCTKQPPATARQKETTPILQESDSSSSINAVEIVNCNNILQEYKTYQTK